MKERGGSIVNIALARELDAGRHLRGLQRLEGRGGGGDPRAALLHCRKSGIAVRVNSIHPDGIWTPMMEASLRGALPGIKPEHLLYDVSPQPKGAPAFAVEVASVVAFLASDDAKAINGAELRVDNGVLGMGL